MPRCKICKDKFTVKYFLQKTCLDPTCILQWRDKVKAKEWKDEKKKIKEELQTVQELIKLTQKVFNSYIRERDKGLPCIACGNANMKKINASHYYNANNHWNIRFHEDNVHSGCEHCNTFLSGNLIPYRENLINKIGMDRFNHLQSIAYETRKFTREELRELAKHYKEKLKDLTRK